MQTWQTKNLIQEYMVAGWGKTNNDPLLGQKDFTELGVSIRTLQRLVVPAVPFAKCTAIFPFVTDKQFCFGGISGELIKFMVHVQNDTEGLGLGLG